MFSCHLKWLLLYSERSERKAPISRRKRMSLHLSWFSSDWLPKYCYLYENFDAHNLTSFLLPHTHTFIFTYVNICRVTFLHISFVHPHNSYLHMYLYTFIHLSGSHTYTHKVMHIPISGYFQQSEDQGMPQLHLATYLSQRDIYWGRGAQRATFEWVWGAGVCCHRLYKRSMTYGNSGNVLHSAAGDDVAASTLSLKMGSGSIWFWNADSSQFTNNTHTHSYTQAFPHTSQHTYSPIFPHLHTSILKQFS